MPGSQETSASAFNWIPRDRVGSFPSSVWNFIRYVPDSGGIPNRLQRGFQRHPFGPTSHELFFVEVFRGVISFNFLRNIIYVYIQTHIREPITHGQYLSILPGDHWQVDGSEDLCCKGTLFSRLEGSIFWGALPGSKVLNQPDLAGDMRWKPPTNKQGPCLKHGGVPGFGGDCSPWEGSTPLLTDGG